MSCTKRFHPQRDYLVFSSVAEDRCFVTRGFDRHERSFDVVAYVYSGTGKALPGLVDYHFDRAGFKFDNFYHFAMRHDLSVYRSVWLVDDDVEMSSADVDALFEIVSRNGLHLAMPAYDTLFNWDIALVDENYMLRYTNFVENGATLFSAGALERCLDTMATAGSGWGADFVWPMLLGFPPKGIAIIDELPCCCHRVPSALDAISTPKERAEQGVKLMHKFGARFFVPRVLGGKRSADARCSS